MFIEIGRGARLYAVSRCSARPPRYGCGGQDRIQRISAMRVALERMSAAVLAVVSLLVIWAAVSIQFAAADIRPPSSTTMAVIALPPLTPRLAVAR